MTPPPPFKHQSEEFERTRDLKSWALWWEMGTGKTRPTIDTAAWLFQQGKIRGVLVLAPKAVAPNWANDELTKHLPDDVKARTKVVLWDTDKANTMTYQQELVAALAHDGLVFVCMSYDGLMTEVAPGAKKPGSYAGRFRKGWELAKDLLTSRPSMMVLDESTRIKDPGRGRTKRVQATGLHAQYRRVLSGTPISNSPFDAYAQVQFLDPFFWQRHGCKGFQAFKTQYADWSKGLISPAQCPHPQNLRPDCGCKTFPILVRYKNLTDLHGVMRTVGSRRLKDEVLDLPPKLYDQRRFSLLPAQQRMYDTLRKEFMVMLADGSLITAPLVITQLLRLQQITSGYCRDDNGRLILTGEANPRVDLLMDTLEDVPHKAIVWCKFREDFAQITARLQAEKIGYVEYHGGTSTEDRERARHQFQNDQDTKLFLGNPQCAGEGLTLTAAKTVVYYNTDFRLAARLQSEDRAHRIGQEHPVQYLDLVAYRTVDERIIQALRDKKDLANLIMGDPKGNWI